MICVPLTDEEHAHPEAYELVATCDTHGKKIFVPLHVLEGVTIGDERCVKVPAEMDGLCGEPCFDKSLHVRRRAGGTIP